jgi:hypothetical protein
LPELTSLSPSPTGLWAEREVPRLGPAVVVGGGSGGEDAAGDEREVLAAGARASFVRAAGGGWGRLRQ